MPCIIVNSTESNTDHVIVRSDDTPILHFNYMLTGIKNWISNGHSVCIEDQCH